MKVLDKPPLIVSHLLIYGSVLYSIASLLNLTKLLVATSDSLSASLLVFLGRIFVFNVVRGPITVFLSLTATGLNVTLLEATGLRSRGVTASCLLLVFAMLD